MIRVQERQHGVVGGKGGVFSSCFHISVARLAVAVFNHVAGSEYTRTRSPFGKVFPPVVALPEGQGTVCWGVTTMGSFHILILVTAIAQIGMIGVCRTRDRRASFFFFRVLYLVHTSDIS